MAATEVRDVKDRVSQLKKLNYHQQVDELITNMVNKYGAISGDYQSFATYGQLSGERIRLYFPDKGDLPVETVLDLDRKISKTKEKRDHERGILDKRYSASLNRDVRDGREVITINFSVSTFWSGRSFDIVISPTRYKGRDVIAVDSSTPVLDYEESSEVLDMVASSYGYRVPQKAGL